MCAHRRPRCAQRRPRWGLWYENGGFSQPIARRFGEHHNPPRMHSGRVVVFPQVPRGASENPWFSHHKSDTRSRLTCSRQNIFGLDTPAELLPSRQASGSRKCHTRVIFARN